MPRPMSVALTMGIPVLAGTDTGVTGALLGISSQIELVLLVECRVDKRRSARLRPTWYMDVAHGDLAAHPRSFAAITELLTQGCSC